MTDLAGKVQWFDRFEVRRPKGFLEILVRLVQGSVALFLSICSPRHGCRVRFDRGTAISHHSEPAVPILLVVLGACPRIRLSPT